MNLKELDSFKISDAISFHDELNPNLWDGQKLRPEVKEQLLYIAKDFLEELGVDDLDVKDITVSGSNAAYSYTPYSDLDLHILVDMSDMDNDEIYRELFNAKKIIYNDTHNITIHGVPVELYVQDAREPVVSLGEYSILQDEWLRIPTKRRANLDQTATKQKYEKLSDIIKRTLKSKNILQVSKVIQKIKQYRKAGLDKGGEFGPENLAYKVLRKQGLIDKLYQLRDKLHSEKLTIEDYDPNGPPPGPEFKPTMPKGTVRVDISDVYDWYKLGQHISNMKGLGKHDFGKGPPSTILSFGDEDLEHKYIQALQKTGLTTTDIDPVDPKQPKGMKRQKVDPTYNVDEDFTREADLSRRDMLKAMGAGAVAASVPGLSKAGEFTDVKGMAIYDPETVKKVWEPRWQELNQRSQAMLRKLIMAAGPEFANDLKGTRLRIRTNHNYAQASAITKDIVLDLSVFWDAPDAALAFAIAHELGHIAFDHINPADSDDESERLKSSAVSRQQELDADTFAVRLCKVLGYNKAEIFKFITQNEQEYRQLEKELQSPLSSHPTHKMRIDRARMNGFQLSKAGIDQMNALKSHLAEGFDKPYPFTWEKSDFGDYDALATLDDGTPLSIMIEPEGDDEWHVRFDRNFSMGVTGEGDAQRVFATVLSAIHQFIQKEHPWRLIFSASKDPSDAKNSESRAKLYNRLIKRYARAWGYDEYSEDHGDQVTYELTRLKQGVAEAESTPQFVYHVTPTKNLKSIAKQGLTPTVGDRTSQIESEKSGIYVFPDRTSAEDAVMNWLGDEFDDEPLTMLKIDVSGLEKNISKGADYELIVGTVIEPSRIKKVNIQLEEASGYIPSYAERNDPRFKTALTVDVHPNTMKKDAKKFGNKISRAGIPPTLQPSGKF